MDGQLFDLYVDYLIASTGATTATGLSQLTDETISHDAITRMLSEPLHNSLNLWKRIKPVVREVASDNAVLVLDDSIAQKPYTDENEIVCWHWDHVNRRSVKGINLLTVLYHSNRASLPISVQLIAKTQEYLDLKTGQHKRRSPISKNEYAQQMLLYAQTLRLPYRYVIADRWYCCSATMQLIATQLKRAFILAINGNRRVACSAEERRTGQYRTVNDLEFVPGESVRVFLKDLDVPVVIAAYVFTNGDGSSGTFYLVSNDTTLPTTTMLDLYKRRWSVEEYHKSLKQNASLCSSPTRRRTTQSSHVFASICAFVKLERLKVRSATNHFALKHRLYMKALTAAVEELRALKHLYGLDQAFA